jgi:hypothetical protein
MQRGGTMDFDSNRVDHFSLLRTANAYFRDGSFL